MGVSGISSRYLICAQIVHTLKTMEFRWDRHKASANLQEHKVDFADAIGIFEDIYALTLREEAHPTESRYVTTGQDFLGRIVTVVYTFRDDDCRIISARKATSVERKEYEKGIRF